jgi:hypothetical protein
VKLDSEYELNVPASEGSQAIPDEKAQVVSQQNIQQKQETPLQRIEEEQESSQQNREEESEIGVPAQGLDRKAWKKQKTDKRSDSEKSYYEISRDKKTNKVRFIMISLFILVLVLVASLYIYNEHVKDGNLERARWEVAQRKNTVDSYLTYMDEFPQGKYSDEAYTKMMSLKSYETEAWQNLITSENTTEFADFLDRYPESPYERMVKIRFDSLMWESSLKENSTQGYSEYLNMSTAGKITGDYIGEAKKRFDMLDQSTPVDEVDLGKIKEIVNSFFIGLSNMSHAELSESLAPVIVRFDKSANLQKEEMIGQLLLLASKADAKSLRFDPEITKLKYEKMGNDSYQVNIPLQKILEDSNGSLNQVKGYIVHLMLNSNYRIYSYYETKPFTTAP